MNKFSKCLFSVLFLVLMTPDAFCSDFLTGDTKLACETILCLSSADRPSECAPALAKYFSIDAKKWKDTVKKRKRFLELCPTASADNNMKTLVEAISKAGGQCDAAALNGKGKWKSETTTKADKCSGQEKNINKWNYQETYTTRVENEVYYVGNNDRTKYRTTYFCDRKTKYLDVPKNPPSECYTLWNHVNTGFTERPHLQKGENNKDIIWVD